MDDARGHELAIIAPSPGGREAAKDSSSGLEFVVPTVLAIGLAILQSIGAVYLKEKYLGPIDQAEAPRSIADSR
jgi:hypothetical protein